MELGNESFIGGRYCTEWGISVLCDIKHLLCASEITFSSLNGSVHF